MASEVQWLIENRVLLLTADSFLTADDFQNAMRRAVELSSQSQSITHMIIDGGAVNSMSAYMVQMMKEALSLAQVNNYRWTVVVPDCAHMVLFSTMIGTMMHRPVQISRSIDSAYGFLTKVDPTLPRSYHSVTA